MRGSHTVANFSCDNDGLVGGASAGGINCMSSFLHIAGASRQLWSKTTWSIVSNV